MKALRIEGFKSFFTKQRVEFADLTLFAGANSSGKSSASQVLLLLKQTLESQYDPGALLLDGPNVRFTSLDQILSKRPGSDPKSSFLIEIEMDDGWVIGVEYGRKDATGIQVKDADIADSTGAAVSFKPGRKFSEQESSLLYEWSKQAQQLRSTVDRSDVRLVWESAPDRGFPELALVGDFSVVGNAREGRVRFTTFAPPSALKKEIAGIIHIQGLRGNPERTYSATARVVKNYQGLFTDYVASVLQAWQDSKSEKLTGLGDDLRSLGLSWKIRTSPVFDTQVEIKVSRLPNPTQGGAHDLVNLADVGIGVSQVLPFLVALRAAKKGQVVFVEQPEIHLHPRAQYALVGVVVSALKRGVRVWIETHSSSFLKGIQTEVAKGSISSERVALNWFSRDSATGSTRVENAVLNELGQYGNWPADFDETTLYAEKEYLNAIVDQLPETDLSAIDRG